MISSGGSMVFTASIDAYNAAGTRVSYAMSKAAELALMRHIARKYGPKGIRANAIAPGLIWHSSSTRIPCPTGSSTRRGLGR
jgi:NAD(P)-dependent dehydrogenase (short-subunit alcohol dehydrogenase family)